MPLSQLEISINQYKVRFHVIPVRTKPDDCEQENE